MNVSRFATLELLTLAAVLLVGSVAAEPAQRSAYFGDLHIHTMYSYDAFLGNVRTTPDDAYNYAKGAAIPHPSGARLRLSGPPLDFLMVSEHAKFLGVYAAQLDPASPSYGDVDAVRLLPQRAVDQDSRSVVLTELVNEGRGFMGPQVTEYAWAKVIAAAERHNDPGRFTTFIGYEYTPNIGNRHLHRNVVFRGGRVPKRPFSAIDSTDPEDLWDWLDQLRDDGIEALAIPHNMNQSDGLAFMEKTWKDAEVDRAFAEKRMRNEPVAEISQQKGTSETHPSLSPNDEWADFQIVQYFLNRAENKNPVTVFKGGYYRDALRTGLEMKARGGFNPFALGAIGSSDTHVSAGPFDESGHFSGGSNDAVARGSAYADYANEDAGWDGNRTPRQATHGTGGLAGIWADENTRDALFAALRRRETFATSGPRIRVRFFAGFDLPADITESTAMVRDACAHGIPMGSVLRRSGVNSPSFLLWAARDPNEGWLQRLQIVKGWVRDGASGERIYDVACSDGLEPDPVTHRCPDNGAAVNLDDCSITRDRGAVELLTSWRDPDFDPSAYAFYYARVLENPSCRWSTWDAIRLGIEPNPDLKATQQERAWSSPIWYEPDVTSG